MSDDKIIPLGPASEVLGHRLGKLAGRRRMDVILEKDNAGELVRALPAEDLYFLIKDIGLYDAAPLVALASPEQFQGFVDLDCWSPIEGGREISPECVLRWLTVCREGSSPESFAVKRAALDLEVLEVVLKRGLRIIDKKAVEDDGWAKGARGEDPEGDWHETPCGSWLLAYEIDGPEGIELKRFIDDLYAQEPFAASRFLSTVRSQLVSELNEHALRFRNGRLEDMGFPPPEVAHSLYAKVDASSTPPPQPTPAEAVPGFFLSEFSGESFLDRAAARVTGASARAFLDRSLMYLANGVLVADRIDPGDTDGVRDAIGRMRAYLNLGLSHLAEHDVDKGAGLLGSASLRHLFQVGFTLTLERRWRAERIGSALGLSMEPRDIAGLLDPPEGAVVSALLARRPSFALALDAAISHGWPEEGEALEAAERAPEVQPPLGARPFAVPDDLRAADEALSRAEAFLSISKAAGLLELADPEADATSSIPTLSVRLLTAMLNLASGDGFEPTAISTDSLDSAVRAARGDGGALHGEIERSTIARLTAADPDHPRAAEALVGLARERYASSFAAIEEPLDPRFVLAVRIVRSPE